MISNTNRDEETAMRDLNYVDISYHVTRDYTELGWIRMVYILSAKTTADTLTKTLERHKFSAYREGFRAVTLDLI